MRIDIIAVGEKCPVWIEQGVHEYINRMPNACKVSLKSVALAKRLRNKNINIAAGKRFILLITFLQFTVKDIRGEYILKIDLNQ